MTKTSYHHGDLKNALIIAGLDILASEGAQALSLRAVAQRAGVSHAAPYAHYADKQALIAAISTEGYRQLFEALQAVGTRYQGDPLRQLVEGAWAYLEFALLHPEHFKLTFSGVIEKQREYPALVEISQRSFGQVVRIVEACQLRGILAAGPADVVAISVWSVVHGLASLLLEQQISHSVLERFSERELLLTSLNMVSQVELTPALIPALDAD